jgi:hypothetical protein
MPSSLVVDRERGRKPRVRLSREARGYGLRHTTIRKQVGRLVAAGGAVCWRCESAIEPGEPWDLGHDDVDRSVYRGPEHRACNRATAGRRGRKVSVLL